MDGKIKNNTFSSNNIVHLVNKINEINKHKCTQFSLFFFFMAFIQQTSFQFSIFSPITDKIEQHIALSSMFVSLLYHTVYKIQ
jgi:hypothetical protein